MSYIEENAYKAMTDIFLTISKDEKYFVNGYFASDMLKVNNQSCVYPCFVGFSSKSIVIVKVSSELEKEDIHLIEAYNIKDVKIKKSFLSKIMKIRIKCEDSRSYTIGVPHVLKYIPTQGENVDNFLEIYQSKI